MMSASGKLMTFSIGHPRFSVNNVVMENFDKWHGANLANSEHLIEVCCDCPWVYGSPLFCMHYKYPTNPQMRRVEGDQWWLCNRQSDPFQDAN